MEDNNRTFRYISKYGLDLTVCRRRYPSSKEKIVDDDEELDQPPFNGAKRDHDEEPLAVLACPFLKHNPRKYQNVRSCSSAGWKSTHRLK